MKKPSVWFRGLSNTGKVTVVSIGTLLSLGTVGALAQSGDTTTPAAPSAVSTLKSAPPAAPKPVTKTETKTEPVAFSEEFKDDAALPKGQTKVAREGTNGERTITYDVITLEDKETSRQEIKNEITKPAINKITLKGTYVAPAPKAAPRPAPKSSCDPNYSGACVPIASDVDCAGGSGNGPAYISGPVTVIGTDIYDLDRDGNGTGCE